MSGRDGQRLPSGSGTIGRTTWSELEDLEQRSTCDNQSDNWSKGQSPEEAQSGQHTPYQSASPPRHTNPAGQGSHPVWQEFGSPAQVRQAQKENGEEEEWRAMPDCAQEDG
jgi:hypothetical protein